jgi:hypothetical protein
MLDLLRSVPVGVWITLGVFAWVVCVTAVWSVMHHFDESLSDAQIGLGILLFLVLPFWPLVAVFYTTRFVLTRLETKYTTCAKCGAICKEKRNG